MEMALINDVFLIFFDYFFYDVLTLFSACRFIISNHIMVLPPNL